MKAWCTNAWVLCLIDTERILSKPQLELVGHGMCVPFEECSKADLFLYDQNGRHFLHLVAYLVRFLSEGIIMMTAANKVMMVSGGFKKEIGRLWCPDIFRFHCECLRTEICLRELTLSRTLNPNPKSSRSVDPQFSHKLLFYVH